MATPWAGYLFESTFEGGALTEWDSTTDTQSKLSATHYATLVRQNISEIPYRGAYAAKIDLSVGTADAYVQAAAWATALAGTIWTRLYVYTENLVMADGDQFSLLELQSAGAVTQAMLGIRKTSGVLQFYAGQTQGAGTTRGTDLIQGQYHLLEIGCVVDAGGANNGTVQLFVDGYQIGATITGLDQAALTQARLGALGIDAGTTAGILLFDQVVASLVRIGGFPERYPQTVVLTKSGHVLPGRGSYMDLYLDPGGPLDNHAVAFDSDEASVLAEQAQISPDLTNDAPYKTNGYIASHRDGRWSRGLFIQLTGTNPRAYVVLGEGLVGTGAIRSYAQQRPAHGPF